MKRANEPYQIPLGRGTSGPYRGDVPPLIAERARDQGERYEDPNENLGVPQVTNWEKPAEATEPPAIHPDDEAVARSINTALDCVYGAFLVCRGMEMSDKLLDVLDALKSAQRAMLPIENAGF